MNEHTQNLIAIGIIIALAVLAIYLYFRFFKLYKVKNIVFVDGSLGTGKSFLSVSIAVRLWKKAHRQWAFKMTILRLLDKLKIKGNWKETADKLEKDEPLLYSNIKLRNVEYVKLTKELIERKDYRFAYKSVLLIDEFSLMADQMMYKDEELNERMNIFWKLWRHQSRGGHVVVNSQSTSDLHWSLKYVLSDYLYIHHRTKLPFVSILKVQEMAYCADKNGQQIMNVRDGDIEEKCKTMLVLNKYFKYYDTYCYSIFTDGLPIYRKLEINGKKDDLKDTELISFRHYKYLREHLHEEENE